MKFGSKNLSLGIMFRREHTPEQLPAFARSAEKAGFDELWVVEDCFYGGGIASAATALAFTDGIAVGLGIMPAVVRNPVFAAMEIATLSGLYPGRFLPGFGHGVADWMRQIGAIPESQLTALEETVDTVKRLLNGERVSFAGRHVHITDAQLQFPPARVPPIALGVRGQKSLQLSGRVADGTILAEFASPDYVKWALEQIALGQANRDSSHPHRLTVFAMAYADADPTSADHAAKAQVVAAIYGGWIDTQLQSMGILAQAAAMRSRNTVEAEIPSAWIHQLTIAGTLDDFSQAVERYIDAGVDSLVLVPSPEQSLAEPDAICARLMQALK